MEKLAVILTANFPFGKGEEFFESELPHLRRHFDKIVILSRDRENPQTRTVPDGVELHRFTRVGFKGRLNYFRIPLMGDFWRELQNIRRGGQAKVTVKIVRSLISFMIHGLHIRRKLREILAQHGKLKNGEGVVFYSYWMEFPVYAALSLKEEFPALKVISRAHGCDLYWERHALHYLPMRGFIADHLDAAFFISEQGREYFIRKNRLVKDGKFKLARLGVRSGIGTAKASNDGIFRVLSCAYVSRVKRLDLLIHALAHVTEFAVEWTHIGDGSELAELKALAQRLLQGRSNIKYEFRGSLSNGMVYDYYQKHCVDVLVNVSSSEGLPVSMMEAFAFGVPVLATAVGGVPEMVNERNGLLLSPEVTPEQVAAALKKLQGLNAGDIGALRHHAYQTWQKSYDANVNYEVFAKDVLQVAGLPLERPVPAPAVVMAS